MSLTVKFGGESCNTKLDIYVFRLFMSKSLSLNCKSFTDEGDII